MLGDHATMPEGLGLFLDRTHRLHPDIRRFISEQVYDGRLESEPPCALQAIDNGPVVGGTGLRWLGVNHESNRTSSVEEAHAVAEALEALLGRGWTDGQGQAHTLGLDDVLVVAPYNAQVHLLAQHIPEGARIGTVDKFQGQQAPVVIVSITASSAEDIPRGMEFLYSRNRINVAVSRAKALSVMVGQPQAPHRPLPHLQPDGPRQRAVPLCGPGEARLSPRRRGPGPWVVGVRPAVL